MINKLISISLLFLFFSCNNSSNPKDNVVVTKEQKQKVLQGKIKLLQDSLERLNIENYLSIDRMDKKKRIALQTKTSVVRQELINQNLNYFHQFPKDSLSPGYLLNICTTYEHFQAYKNSVNYMDTILINYPDFIMYKQILENKAVTLDYFVQPRDTAVIRMAYEQLLSNSTLSVQKQEMYKERLSNLDNDINEIIP